MHDKVVVGVDVGGQAKGFHAVALNDGRLIAKTNSLEPTTIANWCRAQGAVVIAVDAPCRWRPDALARAAERQMASEGINCYYAPTEARAREHAFYTWMLPGKKLYEELSADHALYLGEHSEGPICIETFPHAVACALAGELVSAKQKRFIRGELLQSAGFSLADLSNIDEIDAVLCALAAHSFVRRDFKRYGDPAGGFIIVPATALAAANVRNYRSRSPDTFATLKKNSAALPKILSLVPQLTKAEKLQLRSHLDDLEEDPVSA